MSHEEILKLIGKISPQAKDYVSEMLENRNVEILYSIATEQNKGVFLAVNSDDCCILYASFLNEDNIEEILEIIKNKTSEYILKENSKELCFNVFGHNLKIIDLVRNLGFKSDMEGYHLEYIGKVLSQPNNCNLIDKGFESYMLKDFVRLFDSAYYQLNVDNDWEANNYAASEEHFHQELITLNKTNQVRSFWIDNELIGAYTLYQNYITDIVVNTEYQNKGYGSYILSHCIRDMRVNKSIKNIRLRVTKSNSGAKRLYERNGFIEIACFAEHTMHK